VKDRYYVRHYLLALLLDLNEIEQNPVYHPEGDALFHSLQVFQHALKQNASPILLAAALFHDVGKSHGSKHHDIVGAEMLDGVLNEKIVWLVEHHLDLLRKPVSTEKQLKHRQTQLNNLRLLRKWDLAGRDLFADVITPEEAVGIVMSFEQNISA